MAERTAMMDQYRRAKSRHRDAVLFFRLGDFYEMFFEDAVEVSALLNLTLTKRQGEPMCGVPYHAARSYIARLLKLGKKIAVCEQLSEPGQGKGLVERDVVEVITPGTAMEEDFLDQGANNYLLSLCEAKGRLACAYVDISTAEFRAFALKEGGGAAVEERLRKELYRLAPREVLVQQSLLERPEVSGPLAERGSMIVNRLPDWSFDAAAGGEDIRSRFGLATLKGLGFDEEDPELAAAAALLRYVDDTAASAAPHLSSLRPYVEEDFALVDESSQKNLELVQNLHDGGRAYSLLEVLDHTKTAPGSRLLRQWLLQPLRRKEAVEARLDAVEFLYRDQLLLQSLREALGRLLDAERLASRVAMDKAHAKDLLALGDSIAAAEAARVLLEKAGARGLLAAGPGAEERAAALALRELVGRAVKEEPSTLLAEGDLIREGYDPELDRLRSLKDGARAVLEEYLEEERAASGISTLRVRYNRIIGYYLEVSKGKLEAVPPHFARRQSLVNGERYSTPRLQEIEAEINGATERIVELERRLFLEVREKAKAVVPAILGLARFAAEQDCLASLAWAATVRAYSRPRVFEDRRLRVVEGRHPVVEAHLPAGAFVPNGLELCEAEGRPSFALITGPNMAGKSTFLRQTALIALMAQAGSFVPALEAEIGLVDRIFCRVGAQDNLARGESTFLVEMHETARILNTASERSLVVMDEVGRGTSTIDGLSIAWAVSEELLSGLGCRSLFATHYHELTALEHPGLKNLSLAVLEEEGEVVFLKRIAEGPAASSYGLHVARLAGLPSPVLSRAAEIHAELSRKEKSLPGFEARAGAAERGGGLPGRAERAGPGQGGSEKSASGKSASREGQGGLFSPGDLVLAELASLDTDSLTPLEALTRLAILKKRLQAG